MKTVHLLQKVLRQIDAFIFPHLCVICDAPRGHDDRWFCVNCRNTLISTIRSREFCPRCGINPQNRSCSCSHAWDYPLHAIHSCIDYTGPVQIIMHRIKYQGMRLLAAEAGRLCAETITVPALFKDADCLIPIPLHRKRLKKRGYNQAEWLARGIKSTFPELALHSNLLCRLRATGTQTALDRSDRFNNVAGAFSVATVDSALIAGKNVLLVDDVITTGATTSAAAEALLKAGCARVTALSFARD